MWQTQIVPRLRTVFWEVDPVSALLKNEACVLQDEVVTGKKRECRCSTLYRQTSNSEIICRLDYAKKICVNWKLSHKNCSCKRGFNFAFNMYIIFVFMNHALHLISWLRLGFEVRVRIKD